MGIVIIAAAFACLIGWHVSRAHMTHRAIPVRKGQLRSFRGVRTHHLIWALGMAGLIVLLLLLVSIH
jgi:hypothetical protein